MWAGCRTRRASPTGSSRKRNGNIRRGREPLRDQRRASISATTRRRCAAMATGRTRLPRTPFPARQIGQLYPALTVMPTQRRWGASLPTRSGSTTCMAMCGSGRRTATMAAIVGRRRMARVGPSEIAVTVSFAAGPGRTILRRSAQPTASEKYPASTLLSAATAPPSGVCGLPERFCHVDELRPRQSIQSIQAVTRVSCRAQ